MARILVIDDDPMTLAHIVETLTDAGHELTTASDGWEALKRFRPHLHDLVITDVCMPTVDGSDVLRVLQREVPGTPVLAITAHESIDKGDRTASTVELMSGLGARRVLAKPFAAETLLTAVADCLATRPSVTPGP